MSILPLFILTLLVLLFITPSYSSTNNNVTCALNMAEETAYFYHNVNEWLDVSSSSDVVRVEKLLRLMELRRDDEALIEARDAVRDSQSTDPVLMALMGVCLTIRQSTDLAEQAFDRASILLDFEMSYLSKIFGVDPRLYRVLKTIQASVHYMLGRVRWNLSDYEKSIEALERASEIDSSVPELFEWLARSNDRIGEVDEFLSHWETALRIDPNLTDRYVWPIYCVGMRIQDEHPVRDRLEDEMRYIESKTSVLHDVDTLGGFIERLRNLECDRDFIKNRNTMIRESIAHNSKYTWTNFAYVVVFSTLPLSYTNNTQIRSSLFSRFSSCLYKTSTLRCFARVSNVGTRFCFSGK